MQVGGRRLQWVDGHVRDHRLHGNKQRKGTNGIAPTWTQWAECLEKYDKIKYDAHDT